VEPFSVNFDLYGPFRGEKTGLAWMAYRIPPTAMTPSPPGVLLLASLLLGLTACSSNVPEKAGALGSSATPGPASSRLQAIDVPESVRQLSSRAPERSPMAPPRARVWSTSGMASPKSWSPEPIQTGR
jgi:hypothetical protein